MRHHFRGVGLVLRLLLGCCSIGNLFSHEKDYATCHLWGQLGNQMFQVATTVAYALDHQCEPIFPNLVSTLNGHLNYHYVFHRLNIHPPGGEVFYDHEETTNGRYESLPYESGKNIRLIGYYQVEKYFAHHKEYITELFAPSEDLLKAIKEKYGEILKGPTVAVHIRTFIPDGAVPEIHGIGGIGWGVTWDYYLNAMDHFPDDHTFLIFTDHMGWTKSHFPPCKKKVVFVEDNPHYFDFYFMSLCDHQIISINSSFSWWAAWLNRNPNKTVVVPHFWGPWTDETAFPAGWVRVHAEKGPV